MPTCGKREQPLAPEPVAERAEETPDERAAIGPAGERGIVRDMKESLEERLRPADHDPVPAEEQSTQRRNNRDEPDVAEIAIGGVLRGGVMGSEVHGTEGWGEACLGADAGFASKASSVPGDSRCAGWNLSDST